MDQDLLRIYELYCLLILGIDPTTLTPEELITLIEGATDERTD